jgi:hypothetical protein
MQREKIWETLLVRTVSQALSIFSQAHSLSMARLWAWESARSFLEEPGTFFTKKVPGYYCFESILVSTAFETMFMTKTGLMHSAIPLPTLLYAVFYLLYS